MADSAALERVRKGSGHLDVAARSNEPLADARASRPRPPDVLLRPSQFLVPGGTMSVPGSPSSGAWFSTDFSQVHAHTDSARPSMGAGPTPKGVRPSRIPARPYGPDPGPGHQQDAAPAALQRSAVRDVLASPGQSLEAALREEMEARLGDNFSAVRLHGDFAAHASAAAVGASAYTSGNHIVIGDGGGDKRTLAHELAHVSQQRRGRVAGTDNGSGLRVSDPSDRFERQAQDIADRAIMGSVPRSGAAPVVRPTTDIVVQRNGTRPRAASAPPALAGPALAPPAANLTTRLHEALDIVGPVYEPSLIEAIHAAPVAERQTALADANLRQKMRDRLDRASCLAVMTSLLEGSQNWLNPPNNDFFSYFFVTMGTGTLPNAASMNCWESILYGAYLSGQIDQPWIQNFYQNARSSANPNATIWAALGWSAALPVYDAAHPPTAGQLLFYHTGGPVPGHVALSLGGDQAFSLWNQPNNNMHAQRITVTDLTGAVHVGNPPW